MDAGGRARQERLPRGSNQANQLIFHPLIRVAPGMAQASLFSTASRPHLLLPPATRDRKSECREVQGCAGTTPCASLYTVLLPEGCRHGCRRQGNAGSARREGARCSYSGVWLSRPVAINRSVQCVHSWAYCTFSKCMRDSGGSDSIDFATLSTCFKIGDCSPQLFLGILRHLVERFIICNPQNANRIHEINDGISCHFTCHYGTGQ